MNNEREWNKEYSNPKLISLGKEPLKEVVSFFRYLKKKKIKLDGANVLDAGCGTGKNSIYAFECGCHVVGVDISKQAILLAGERAKESGALIDLHITDISKPLQFQDSMFDIVISTMAYHLLDKSGREMFAREVSRVMKSGAYLFLKTLAIEGDQHAKKLIKTNPGREEGSYIMPVLNIQEYPSAEMDLRQTFSEKNGFNIESMDRSAGYPSCNGRVYKRMFWSLIVKKT